jgi:hypothetical protein
VIPVAPTIIPATSITPIETQNIVASISIITDLLLRFKIKDGFRELDDLAHG